MWTIQLSFLPFFIIRKSLLSYLTLHITSQFLTRTVQWSSTSFSNMIWYDIFNCNWVATRWQLFSTHIHTNNTGNVTKQTIQGTSQNKQYIEQHNNYGECGLCPVFAGFTLAFALQLRKKHGKTSVTVHLITHQVCLNSLLKCPIFGAIQSCKPSVAL
jgi:hypothetical protein